MATDIDVVNQALIVLESNTITSIDDEGNTAAVMRAIYDLSRRFVLRDNDFGFSRAYVELTEDPNAPLYVEAGRGKMRGFRLPANHVRTRQVLVDEDDARFYRMVGRYVYARAEKIGLFYIFDATVALWDDAAVECLSYYLAHKAAMAITQSNEVKKQALADYVIAQQAAKTAAGLEEPGDSLRSEGRLTSVRRQTGTQFFIN